MLSCLQLKRKKILKFFSGFDATFSAGGHTHTHQLCRVKKESWYLNPGSVSLSYNWQLSNMQTGEIVVEPWCDYVILKCDEEGFGETFRHVYYDFEEFSNLVRNSGRPYAEESLQTFRGKKAQT